MKEKGWGRIVNFASLQTTAPFPGGIATAHPRAASAQLTRAMAEAWSREGHHGQRHRPGLLPDRTDSGGLRRSQRAATQRRADLHRPQRRAEDIDGPLLFLCSDASGYVTGQSSWSTGGSPRNEGACLYRPEKRWPSGTLPDPEPGKRCEVKVIRVDSVGICGSDMHAFLGHDERRPHRSFSARGCRAVVGGRHWTAAVTVNPLVTCGTCRPAARAATISARPADHLHAAARRRLCRATCDAGAQSGRGAGHSATIRPPLPNRSPVAGMPCGWAKRAALRPMAKQGACDRRRSDRPWAALSLKAHGDGATCAGRAQSSRARSYLKSSTRRSMPMTPDQAETSGQFDLIVDGVGYAATRARPPPMAKPGGVIVHIGLGSPLMAGSISAA
jgi:hypothetical protein